MVLPKPIQPKCHLIQGVCEGYVRPLPLRSVRHWASLWRPSPLLDAATIIDTSYSIEIY